MRTRIFLSLFFILAFANTFSAQQTAEQKELAEYIRDKYDKREVMKQKDIQRDIVAGLKERSRGSRDRE